MKADAALDTARGLAASIGATPLLSVASALSFSQGAVYPDPAQRSLAERIQEVVDGPVVAGLHSIAAANLLAAPPDEDTLVSITHSGYIKRADPAQFRSQHRGGRGVKAAQQAGSVDICLLIPGIAMQANERGFDLTVVAQNETAKTQGPDSGSIVVLKDSPFQKLADLKGKRIAHTTPSSNSGNLAPRALFPAEGLVPDKDYKPLFSGKHEHSIAGVAAGDYDAAPIAHDDLAIVTTQLECIEHDVEGAVGDGKGRLFVNNEHKNTIQVIDQKTMKAVASWPVEPCKGPTGIAYDAVTQRIFAGCSGTSVVVDAKSGAIKWTAERPDMLAGYAVPVICQAATGG